MWAACRRATLQQVGASAGTAQPLASLHPDAPTTQLDWIPPCQAGDLAEELGDTARALECFTRLLTQAPHDSGVLSRLGALHAK